MRSAGAATRREQEPPPDAAAVIAGLGRVIAGSGEVHGRLRRHERRIASVITRMERDADLAALAGDLRTVLATVTVELISDAAHCAELREQAEALAPLVAFREMMTATLIAEGRRLEQAERDAAEAARPVRHRHRKPRLSVVGGTAVTLAAASVAGGAYVAQDSALVHHWSAASPAAVRLHEGPADSAVPVPSWSPSAKPSADVKAAHPAPVVTASPTPSSPPPTAPAPSVPPPPPPVTVPAGPVLAAPSLLDLGGSHFGTLPLSVTGSGEVAWTATATDGIRLQQSAGVVVPGQPVELQVDDPTGNGGWIYFSAGPQALAVHVVPFGTPAVALP